jgi:hypothetical protein
MNALSDPVLREIDTVDFLGQFASKPHYHPGNEQSKRRTELMLPKKPAQIRLLTSL